jgi:hypothetical protein
MGKRSKATTTRINNLRKSKINQNPTVEEVSDESAASSTSTVSHLMQCVVLYLNNLINLIWVSYANRAARFISAYGQDLTGPEAAWANRKYHGHRTLPPEMASKLKKEHEKKYGIQTNNL